MRLHDLNKVEQKTHGDPILLKVDGHCDVAYTLWLGEVHTSVPKLRAPSCSWISNSIVSSGIMELTNLTCSIFVILHRTFTNTSWTLRETVEADGM